ncbi:uncharacterized protein LOC124168661 [Ischnura elegans]|uniref:uncharacterized protein LOC124168661 n=1 Tax=Ischnura elegans TaxID=197161 RepID=UPI001ED89909|nr:uncharacterized protein LOC124168661 [Ischnura elegans]
MSFFSSLQQYVSSGVASLNLSPKRFSLGREDNATGQPPGAAEETAANTGSVRRKTLPVTPTTGQHGQQQQLIQLPVSPMGGGVSPQRGSIASSCGELVVPPGRRSRQSWADIEQSTVSGAEEAADGSFFESFTALPWKLENRRLIAVREGEGGLEQLYVELLYTITNKVGAPTGQFSHYKEELYSYAQEAFGLPDDLHRKFLSIATEEKPPIVVLNLVVLEAEGLEAKDANDL